MGFVAASGGAATARRGGGGWWCRRRRGPRWAPGRVGSTVQEESSDDGVAVAGEGQAEGRKAGSGNGNGNGGDVEDEVGVRNVDIVVCHKSADFDSLAAAVGLAKLRGPGTFVVLPGGESPLVKQYMALHYQFFPFLPAKAVDPSRIRWMGVVDTQRRERLGMASKWVDEAETVVCFDHHVDAQSDLGNAELVVDRVGAVTTLIAERIQQAGLQLTASEATLLCLAIHADTGSLTFENTTPRDACMLAWLLSQGASQRAIAEFSQPTLTTDQQRLLSEGLDSMVETEIKGCSLGTVVLRSESFVKGMAQVAQDLMELSGADMIILVSCNPAGRRSASKTKPKKNETDTPVAWQVSIICRARPLVEGINFHKLLKDHCGGGGHARAAAASLKTTDLAEIDSVLEAILRDLEEQLPAPKLARDYMSQGLVLPEDMGMDEAGKRLLDDSRGAVVVDGSGRVVGVLSDQDVAKARTKGRLNTPVKGWVRAQGVCLPPDAPLHEAERVILEKDVGRIPVVDDDGRVIGIVSRADVLKQRNLL